MWVLGQLNALVVERSTVRETMPGERGRRVSRASVIRDALAVGLLALHREGVEAPGFDPAAALVAAADADEPTGI